MSEEHLQGVWAVFRSDAKVIHSPQLTTVHETCVEMLAAISTRKDTQTKQNHTLVYLCFVLMVRPTSLTVCPLKNDIQNIILASELYWGWLIKVGENCLPHYRQGTTQGKKQR